MRDKNNQHRQIIDFKESHCIIYVAGSTQLSIPVSTVKLFGVDIKKMGLWSIVLYQDFLKITQKAALGSHSLDNMKQSANFVVTEWALNAVSLVPHQFKNDMTSKMTWWFPSLSFNEDTILSTQHHQACDKIPNCWHWDQSLHSYPYIFATTKRKLYVSVPPIPRSDMWKSASMPFMQTLLTHAPAPTEALIRTLL